MGFAKKPTKIEIVDDLESTEDNAALSANQGRVLDEKVTEVRVDYGDHDQDFSSYFNSMIV